MAGYIGGKAVNLSTSGADISGTANLDIVDIDGAVDMATTALVTGVLTTTAATVFNGGFASNANSTVGGTLGVTGVVTANAGVVVDNFTLDGTTLALSSGDMTLDSAGDIVLDAAGEDIKFFVGGSAKGRFTHSNGDFVIQADTQDKDMIFKGDDGGTSFTALTLDMSDAGTAIFNHDVATGLNGQLQARDASGDISVMIDNLSSGSNSGRISIDPANSAASSVLQIWIDNAAKYTFENDGDFNILDGNLVVGTSGHGIDFSAQTQSPSYTAQSEILDHYEEGEWSPTWVAASGTIAANTNTSGRYTRIGRVVYIEGYISYQSNSSASGAISIAGLPFTAVTTGFGQSSNQAGGVSSFANSLWSSNSPNAGRIPANTATIIPNITTATGSTITQFSDFNQNANYSQFVFFGHYLVNQ